jgi:hypothetical protein
MVGFSYNVSLGLKKKIDEIDSLRTKILLTPIPPKAEIRLQWEAKLNKIYWILLSDNESITKSRIIKFITDNSKSVLSKEEKEINNLKKVIDFITFHYSASVKEVGCDNVLEIYKLLGSGGRLIILEEIISQFLKYLHVKKEHPIVQSGIAQIQIMRIHPFSKNNNILSMCLASVFLHKEGYDLRNLFVPEEQWVQDTKEYKEIIQSTKEGNLTFWLEYYANGLVVELDKLLKKINSLHFQTEIPASFFELNDRQREILSLMEKPEIKLTNRMVQRNCKISQITASRDLAKLASLNLVYSHGKGRSVFYTRL